MGQNTRVTVLKENGQSSSPKAREFISSYLSLGPLDVTHEEGKEIASVFAPMAEMFCDDREKFGS